MTLPTLFGCKHILGKDFLASGTSGVQFQKKRTSHLTAPHATSFSQSILIVRELPNQIYSDFERVKNGCGHVLHDSLQNNGAKETSKKSPRLLFPRGLVQPEGSFRFSLDALLLARFLHVGSSTAHMLDIGTGCGVVALSMLLNNPSLHAVALDAQKILLEATLANAHLLGVAQRMLALHCDVERIEYPNIFPGLKLLQEQCDVVVANPPYRLFGTGREPLSPLRRQAFFGTKETLKHFCALAAFALRIHGSFGIIFPADQAQRLYKALHGVGLTIQRVLPVYSLAGNPPTFVLVEAVKKSNNACEQKDDVASFLAPPLMQALVLYEESEKGNRLTAEALAFCPELQCNQG